jgi:hypothetical protein
MDALADASELASRGADGAPILLVWENTIA